MCPAIFFTQKQSDHAIGGKAADDAEEEKEDGKLSVFADEQRSEKIIDHGNHAGSPDEHGVG